MPAVGASADAAADTPSNHNGLDEDATLQDSIEDVASDWSETGRGSHVDFSIREKVPLSEGQPITRTRLPQLR